MVWWERNPTQSQFKELWLKQWHLYAHFKTSRSCNSMGQSNVSRLWQKFLCEENEGIILYWYILKVWNYEFGRWNVEEPMLECHLANTTWRNFWEKPKVTVKISVYLHFLVFLKKKSFPKDISRYQETLELGILLRKTSLEVEIYIL